MNRGGKGGGGWSLRVRKVGEAQMQPVSQYEPILLLKRMAHLVTVGFEKRDEKEIRTSLHYTPH